MLRMWLPQTRKFDAKQEARMRGYASAAIDPMQKAFSPVMQQATRWSPGKAGQICTSALVAAASSTKRL